MPSKISSTLYPSAVQSNQAGPDSWTVIENSGDRVLIKLNNGVVKLRDLGESKSTDLLDPKGKLLKQKQGKWRIIAADRYEGDNLIALRHKNNQAIKIWTFDKSWSYQKSGKSIKADSKKFLKEEQRFSQKLSASNEALTSPNPSPSRSKS